MKPGGKKAPSSPDVKKLIKTKKGLLAADGSPSPSPKKAPREKTMLDWFEFETRIWKTVFDLVDPNVQEVISHGGKLNEMEKQIDDH